MGSPLVTDQLSQHSFTFELPQNAITSLKDLYISLNNPN